MTILFRASLNIKSIWGDTFYKGAYFLLDLTRPQCRVHVKGPIERTGAASIYDYGDNPRFWMDMGFEPFDEKHRLLAWDDTEGVWVISTERHTRMYLLMET